MTRSSNYQSSEERTKGPESLLAETIALKEKLEPNNQKSLGSTDVEEYLSKWVVDAKSMHLYAKMDVERTSVLEGYKKVKVLLEVTGQKPSSIKKPNQELTDNLVANFTSIGDLASDLLKRLTDIEESNGVQLTRQRPSTPERPKGKKRELADMGFLSPGEHKPAKRPSLSSLNASEK